MEITIKIHDYVKDGEDKVSVVSNPSMEALMARAKMRDLTAAEGYAYNALNTIWKLSKEKGPMKIWLPKIGRA